MPKKIALEKDTIIKALKEHKQEIKTLGVKKIGLFVSNSKNNQNKKSDLDFLAVFDEPTFDNYMELKIWN